MTAKPVIPRAKARADAEMAVDHYAMAGGSDLAIGFIDALEQAYAYIGETPTAGSPRWSHELDIPGLRSTRIRGFPWRIFYLELATHVDVWRILHVKRDMPSHVGDYEK